MLIAVVVAYAGLTDSTMRDAHVGQIAAVVDNVVSYRPDGLAAAPNDAQPAQPAATRTPRPDLVVTPTTVPVVAPPDRHMGLKEYMLERINRERRLAGVAAVTLGTNVAAQLHAEATLEHCSSSHWGPDGLKPYMRYSLAGGYQTNGENMSGIAYCLKWEDGYESIRDFQEHVDKAMYGWLNSEGHLRNLLDPLHKRVNIGIAYDWFNSRMVQHFEGDYVRYEDFPVIRGDMLSLSGHTVNGATVSGLRALKVNIYYDAPPGPLTAGQLALTYGYDNGLMVASLVETLPAAVGWPDDLTTTHMTTFDPALASPNWPPATSPESSRQMWEEASGRYKARQPHVITVPWIDAQVFTIRDNAFTVQADISAVLDQHGPGVYSLMVWGKIGGEAEPISQYAIFHEVAPPSAYSN